MKLKQKSWRNQSEKWRKRRHVKRAGQRPTKKRKTK